MAPLPPITPKQHEILSLVHRFRFLDRSRIQSFLGHKTHKTIYLWLDDLTSKHYLRKTGTAYHIKSNGIRYLKKILTDPALHKLYREKERSTAFIDKCLFLADIALQLQYRPGYQFLTRSQLPEHATEFNPDACILRHTETSTETFFLLLAYGLPAKAITSKIRGFRNLHFGFEEEALPSLLLVCDSSKRQASLKRCVRRIFADTEEDLEISIRLAQADMILTKGITGQIWTDA